MACSFVCFVSTFLSPTLPLPSLHKHTHIAWCDRQVPFQHLLPPVHCLSTPAHSQCYPRTKACNRLSVDIWRGTFHNYSWKFGGGGVTFADGPSTNILWFNFEDQCVPPTVNMLVDDKNIEGAIFVLGRPSAITPLSKLQRFAGWLREYSLS